MNFNAESSLLFILIIPTLSAMDQKSQQMSNLLDSSDSSVNSVMSQSLQFNNSIEVETKQKKHAQGVIKPQVKAKEQKSEMEILVEVHQRPQSQIPPYRSELPGKSSSAFGKKNQESGIQDVMHSENGKKLSDSSMNDSFYNQRLMECIEGINSPELLELARQKLAQHQKKLKSEVVVAARPNQAGEVTQEKYEKIYQKYQKYKELYAEELKTSKKLRGELRNIYHKVSRIE